MKIDLTLLRRIHEGICREATGCPDCFAQELGISKRLLHIIVEYMKAEFNAPITYSRSRKTYHYLEEWDFFIGDLKRIRAELIKGLLETIRNTVKILALLSFVVF